MFRALLDALRKYGCFHLFEMTAELMTSNTDRQFSKPIWDCFVQKIKEDVAANGNFVSPRQEVTLQEIDVADVVSLLRLFVQWICSKNYHLICGI